jgi:hypothetical protein
MCFKKQKKLNLKEKDYKLEKKSIKLKSGDHYKGTIFLYSCEVEHQINQNIFCMHKQ